MTLVLFVNTKNTGRHKGSWIRGNVMVPSGVERIVERVGRENKGEYMVTGSHLDTDTGRWDYDTEPDDKWFADDLYPVLGEHRFFAVTWFNFER